MNATIEERRLLALRERNLLQQRLRIKQENGLAFYEPFDKQDAFHKAASAKHRMVRSGNRFGKSTMGCAEDLSWMLGERPWYAKGDSARTSGIPQRPNKGLVITTDWDKVNEIWTSQRGQGTSVGKIWQFAPRGYIKHTKRNHSGAIEELVGANGSILRFDTVESFKKNPQGSESSDWDFLHIDEPCPEGMYKANARGLIDRGGSDWFTLTPLSEGWINDMFFPRPGEPRVFREGTVWAMQGNTEDNPHNTAQAIEDFKALLTPDEAECRLRGLPLELSGLVYKTFRYDKHVLQSLPTGWSDFNTPPKDYILYCAIDTHPQTPMAVLFVAVSPLGQRFIYDELWVKCGPRELAQLILFKLKGYSYGIPKCEPAAWISDPMTNSCFAEEMGKEGLFVDPASKGKSFGITKMGTEFKKENNIFVAPNLTRFLFEIHRYCFDKENKPQDKDDHMMENMYRIFINDPCWYNPDTANDGPIGDITIDKTELSLPRWKDDF